MNHKRGRAGRSRAGCKPCKPWKINGVATASHMGEKFSDHRRRHAADAQLRKTILKITLAVLPLNRYPPFRKAAITCFVSGRTPRQSRYDSAACSTSIPRPSVAVSAPCSMAHSRNGVGLSPYIMS